MLHVLTENTSMVYSVKTLVFRPFHYQEKKNTNGG